MQSKYQINEELKQKAQREYFANNIMYQTSRKGHSKEETMKCNLTGNQRHCIREREKRNRPQHIVPEQ